MSDAVAPSVLLTGATGFVGGHLLARLNAEGRAVRTLSRQPVKAAAQTLSCADLAGTDTAFLEQCCAGVRHVVHVAGIAHDNFTGAQAQARLRAFNVDLTLRLYEAALRQGCESFVWLSSSKVLGDESATPLEVLSPYAPVGAYAQSKVEAEQALLAAAQPQTRLLILRPPLVYGPGVGANFKRLMAAALGRWPLPLASARAKRSFVSAGNLSAALVAATQAPPGIYHIADPEPVSVAQLLTEIAACAQRSVSLWSCPQGLMRPLLAALGQGDVYQRLFAPLLLATSDSERRLQWTPPFARAQQLKDTVTWYLSQR